MSDAERQHYQAEIAKRDVEVARLRAENERMKPVYDAALMYWLALCSEQGPEIRKRGEATHRLRQVLAEHDELLAAESK